VAGQQIFDFALVRLISSIYFLSCSFVLYLHFALFDMRIAFQISHHGLFIYSTGTLLIGVFTVNEQGKNVFIGISIGPIDASVAFGGRRGISDPYLWTDINGNQMTAIKWYNKLGGQITASGGDRLYNGGSGAPYRNTVVGKLTTTLAVPISVAVVPGLSLNQVQCDFLASRRQGDSFVPLAAPPPEMGQLVASAQMMPCHTSNKVLTHSDVTYRIRKGWFRKNATDILQVDNFQTTETIRTQGLYSVEGEYVYFRQSQLVTHTLSKEENLNFWGPVATVIAQDNRRTDVQVCARADGRWLRAQHVQLDDGSARFEYDMSELTVTGEEALQWVRTAPCVLH